MSLVEPANLVSAANNNSISTVAVKAGTRVVLACHARRSNPQPTIAWFKDGYPMLLNVDEQQNLTSTLVAADKEYDTVSHMTFVVTSSDHLKDVRCDVGIRDVARTMHASLGLEVKCNHRNSYIKPFCSHSFLFSFFLFCFQSHQRSSSIRPV